MAYNRCTILVETRDKQGMVRDFHKRNKYTSGWVVKYENESFINDCILSFVSRVISLMLFMFQRRANRTQKNFDARLYRALLHLEEAGEICDALVSRDECELADGLGDLLYVVYGTADCYSLPMDEVFKEIHEANMKKKVRGVNDPRMRDKGSDWKKPDIAKAISEGRVRICS